MRLDDKLIEGSSIKSESASAEEGSDVVSSKTNFSNHSLISRYYCESTKFGDSVSDSGAARVSQRSQCCLDSSELVGDNNFITNCNTGTRTNEICDRESVLHELAKARNSSVLCYVLNIEQMRKDAMESSGNPRGGITDVRTTLEEETFKDTPRTKFERIRNVLQAVPDSMLHLLIGLDRPGDCGRPFEEKPDWLDVEKLRRGQKFAEDFMFFVSFANMLSLFATFSFEDGLGPLILNGKSSTPFAGFKRMLSTGLRFRRWYTLDLWAKESRAWKDILTVRAMHAAVSRKLEGSTDGEIAVGTKIPDAWCPMRENLIKDFSETCAAPAIGQCPYTMGRKNPSRVKGINQTDMAIAQWSFVGLIICFPECFGMHYATDEDLEDYCYFWRTVGYQLGIEDEFNFCRGTLEDIRQRSRDVLETWIKPNFREITPEWEHVIRCFVSGTGVLVPLPCSLYETALLYLTDILGLKMSRLYAALSYKDWIIYNIVRFVFNHITKIPGVMRAFNRLLNNALDRAAKLNSEELEAVRIKLSNNFGNYAKANS